MAKEELGPIEAGTWPRELTAHAVDKGPARRLHGYDVEQDLAKFYRFTDVFYLSITGDLPDDARSRAFEIALVFSSSMSVGEAPVHASLLARLCGCRAGGVMSVASLSLGEHTDRVLERIGDVLSQPIGEDGLPIDLRAKTDDERASVARLATLVRGVVEVPALAADAALDVALVAVLRAAGLTTNFQLVAALSLGRMPSALAEASATKPADFGKYPIDTPHFEYVPPGGQTV